MIHSLTDNFVYSVLYLNSEADTKDHGVLKVKTIIDALEHLSSDAGKKRIAHKLADDVRAHGHIVHNFTEIAHYLEENKTPPAMIILDEKVTDDDTQLLKGWIDSWQDKEDTYLPIYLLRITPNAKTSFSIESYTEAKPDILEKGHSSELYSELATGVMYAHNARHPQSAELTGGF